MRKIYESLVVVIFCILLFISVINIKSNVNINENKIPLANDGELLIQNNNDKLVIPDKFNTGLLCDEEELQKVAVGDSINGIKFKASGDKIAVDFYYGNKNVEGNIEINGYDFSDKNFVLLNDSLVQRKICITFRNCKFSSVATSSIDSNVYFEFINCEIKHAGGGNCSFDKCHFGNSYSDGMNPVRNVSVTNCYFSNMSGYILEGSLSLHTDGIQIFGDKNSKVENIKINNCRFEIPQIEKDNKNVYVNSCIAVGVEYCDADNVSISDCYLNGGSYSMYVCDNKGAYKLENVSIGEIKVGCSRSYGILYKNTSSEIDYDYNSIGDTAELYVSSVFREDKNTNIVVSNDTNQERKYRIYTSNNTVYEYTIEACPKRFDIGELVFEDLPIDRVVSIPEICDWLVCYEVLSDGNNETLKQLRYMNWTDKEAYINFDNYDMNNQGEQVFEGKVVDEGSCGKNVSYKFYEDGKLILSGEGVTRNYSSKSPAPWDSYSLDITDVVIEKGITVLGGQLFRSCKSIKEIEIPNTVYEIKSNAFINCKSLETVVIPDSVKVIDKFAFWGTSVDKIDYQGNDEDRREIEISEYNPQIIRDIQLIDD